MLAVPGADHETGGGLSRCAAGERAWHFASSLGMKAWPRNLRSKEIDARGLTTRTVVA